MISNWLDALTNSWTLVWDKIVNFTPNLLGAVLILIIGWLVAVLLERLINQVLRVIGFQGLMDRAKVEDSIRKMGIGKDTSGLIAALVKWVVLLVVFLAAADALQLPQIVDFFKSVLGYVPSVAAAAAIALIGMILAHFLSQVVEGGLKAAEYGYADLAGTIVRWAIWVFTFLAVLVQLGVASYMIQTLFTGFVALLAIAGGLAFGLGGQAAAKDMIEKTRRNVTRK